jgi:NADH-quinone oxidoreductase subunit N
VVAIVRRETGGDDLTNFAGLASRSPLLGGCMAIFMLSLAGLPPLAGFFGKFYLFSAALRAGENQGLLWLVALALFGSLISLYYYLIVLKIVFLGPALSEVGRDESSPVAEMSPPKLELLQMISVSILALAIVLLGLFPTPLLARIIASVP